MTNTDKAKASAIRAIEESLQSDVRLPHQAASIALDIFMLMVRLGASDPEAQALRSRFHALLSSRGMEDLLENQVEYAMRLAQAEGALEYEEMHKLLSLCDRIYQLEFLGLSFEAALRARYEQAVRDRFRRERNVAHMTAQDRVEDWNKDKWWYRENLH
jgi:hypothetical protein